MRVKSKENTNANVVGERQDNAHAHARREKGQGLRRCEDASGRQSTGAARARAGLRICEGTKARQSTGKGKGKGGGSRKKHSCSICTSLGKPVGVIGSHDYSACVQEGGGMAGKTIQQAR